MSLRDPTLRELVAPIVREVLAEVRSDTLMVSQLNAEAVLGIPRRIHLENCRRPDFTPRVIRAGKLRLVDAHEYRAWLRSLERSSVTTPDELEDEASAVLAELGLQERTRNTKKHRSSPRDSGSSDP